VNEPDLESLPPELARLIKAERTRPNPPAAMQARVLERFATDLLDAPPPAPDPGPTQEGVPGRATPVLLRRLPLAATMLALGGLGGAGLHAHLTAPAPAVIQVSAPAPRTVPPPAPPPETLTPPPAPEETAPPKSEHRPAPRRQAPAPLPAAPPAFAPPPSEIDRRLARDRDLAAERALIEPARTALARGKPGDALALLVRHEHQFARGQLAEERDALMIVSLVARGERVEAQARATKFRQSFPKSMLIRTVEAALADER